MNDEVGSVTLEALRVRITGVFPQQIRAAVAPLSEEQMWWRPNEPSNSVGNILLHLTGSLNHFLNRNLGGLDYVRDRPAEFAERGPLPKADLMAGFEAMVSRAIQTFDGLTPEILGRPSPEPTMHRMVVEDLVNIAAHLANHTGQIVWIAKMLHEGAVDETWMRAHRDQGAWKRPPSP